MKLKEAWAHRRRSLVRKSSFCWDSAWFVAGTVISISEAFLSPRHDQSLPSRWVLVIIQLVIVV